jgi:hypothetical protein
MAVSPYFHHIDATEEQDLYHSLAEEMIFLSGINVYYIKTDALTDGNFDPIFSENRFENLDNATEIEMYLKSMDQPYEGDDLFSKFGLQQAEQCTFLVGYRRFETLFNHRPREGDFVYIPTWDPRGPDDIFRIGKVEINDYQFKALGAPVYYFLKCERAKFSHQAVNTGVTDLDQGVTDIANNNSVVNDHNQDNDAIETVSDIFINFSESNPFGTP